MIYRPLKAQYISHYWLSVKHRTENLILLFVFTSSVIWSLYVLPMWPRQEALPFKIIRTSLFQIPSNKYDEHVFPISEPMSWNLTRENIEINQLSTFKHLRYTYSKKGFQIVQFP